MVTMSSDKPASRKSEAHHHALGATTSEYSRHFLIYQKMEKIMERMQDEKTGVPVKTVKSFLNKIPSVFTVEALHLAQLLASHGYLFPIDDHTLTVKNDNTFYRFQTPYFWPSNNSEPENTDYAVYLCKRTMLNKNKLNLSDFEAENFSRLQKMFTRKWEFIYMQAEAQSKVDKKREKMERKILESQERAFWDVHRPMPGCVNTTEIDIRKARVKHKVKPSALRCPAFCSHDSSMPIIINTEVASQSHLKTSMESLKKEITVLKVRLERRNIKLSKIAETYIQYFEQYVEYDSFFTSPEYPNPWLTDNSDLWDQESSSKEASVRRVKRWAFALQEVLADPLGKQHFMKFLEKEFSSENLKFWDAVQNMKSLPLSKVKSAADEIWTEYLSSDASCPINVDSQSHELSKKNMEKPDRWTFDIAAAHVYHLMKSDSYPRYIRSEMYKEFLNGSKKKASVKGIRSIVSFSSVKKEPSMTSVLE
ncbi:regulator of G-protein signaling 7 isoform X2 [Planococcus citri]|uniref:regulator of G-protein signaling 7 isoform X2 n=1 Tax=Planococcus citri TaxID=170843 RepID=UPI0031F85C90